MKLEPDLEQKIARKAKTILEKCRPNWDWPHTLTAVYWMKQLISENGGNERILIPAIYFHDVGYFGLLKAGYSYRQLRKYKPLHMERGPEIVRQELADLDFTKEEIDEIAHLVAVHDLIDRKKSSIEQMVFEADCLGMIDRERAGGGTMAEAGVKDFLNNFEKRRMPQIQSKLAREKVKGFLEKEKLSQ